ncbi:sensor domain-containing diguanylate cyclase [Vibrio sp. TH_r3]|uniref:sensor domain-containing diguanylate cyclase n=1 Tax=Vibrio sp. TH_r3 TaxID=3082084 RepID=UPI0029531CCF|nr:sensor domain-containing diguanylate cyclase [Vibrio sp. TH_r3]MDV7104646.1 sensor domain-containing diguanylate cyclase [Vibrio sp. TH_r3]
MPEINIDSTYGVIVIKDLNLVYVDDNYARIYGYKSAKELMSNINSFLDLIDPKHHQVARENYYRQMSGQLNPRGRTFKNIDRNGRVFTVFAIDHVIQWKGEQAMQVTVMDMSALEDAHQKITENERKYKQLISSSGQGITVHKNFKPLMVNQAWVDLMHAPSIEFVLANVSLMEFIPKKEQSFARQQYRDIISGELRGSNRIVENICFDGAKRYFRVYDNRIEWDGEPAIQAVIEDVTEKVELEKKLKYLSITDSLTQVYNRRKLDEVLKQERNRQTRYGHPLSILLIDLDYFKTINDNFGHQAGDETLIAVASLLKDSVRKTDTVGRWGGEEFLIICPSALIDAAQHLAEKLRKAISRLENGVPRTLTASIGVASAKNNEPIEKLLKRVDEALYCAKHNGRNRVEVSQ